MTMADTAVKLGVSYAADAVRLIRLATHHGNNMVHVYVVSSLLLSLDTISYLVGEKQERDFGNDW